MSNQIITHVASSATTFTALSTHSNLASVAWGTRDVQNGDIDPSVPGNRLQGNTNGTYEVVPKSPAFIFGERVIAPALEAASKIVRWTWSTIFQFDQTLTKWISWPPGVQAAEKHPIKVLGKNPLLAQDQLWWEIAGIDPSTLVGDFLEGLFKDIEMTMQEIINNAENAVAQAEIEACREVTIAIENTKEAYKESLEFTIKEVNDAITNDLGQLFSMADQIAKKNMDKVSDLIKQAQQLVNSLPFSNKQPQLTSVRPRYIVPTNSSNPILILFDGNFFYSADKDCKPSFSVSNLSLPLVSSTTQRLMFSASNKNFPPPLDLYSYNYLVGNLLIPWKSGWIITQPETSQYNVFLGILPLSPGKISLEYTEYVPVRSTQPYASAEQKAWCDNHYKQNWVVMTFPFYPDEGWHFDTNTLGLSISYAVGSHSERFTQVDKDQVVLEYGCSAKDGKHMGRINFVVNGMEYKDGTQPKKTSQALDLKWGERKVIGNPTLITFEPFDGSPIQQYAGPTLDDTKYIQISSEGGQLAIKAVPPSYV